VAALYFEKDKPKEEWPALVSKHISNARTVADEIAEDCYKDGRHLVFLDIDSDGFPAALKHSEASGVIHVFRSEAPTPGSRCVVNMPPGPRPKTPVPAGGDHSA